MIVVGVDPGAKDTGIAVVDWTFRTAGPPPLLASTTISRTDDATLASPAPEYLLGVRAAVREAILEFGAAGLGIEGVVRPHWHHRGKVKPIDPSALLACAQVLGGLLAHTWIVPSVVVDPRGNGKLFPLTAYPEPLTTHGKGNDKRRHERSAYDVAVTATTELARRGVK